MSHEWSHYQQAIFDAVAHTEDSLLIEAVAGSGKTTSIVEAINHVPREQSVCFLAFNKAIADELKRRVVAPNAKCLTLHASGWAAWRQHLAWEAGECQVDGGKMFDVVREELSWEDRKQYPALGRLVALAKMAGIVPQGYELGVTDGPLYVGLLEDTDDAWEDLIDHYTLDPDECSVELARKVLGASIACSRRVVDFDDMLYMPIVSGAKFEPFDVVFVDEAQDVSAIQMEMIKRMVNGGGRVIAVGDRKQSCYGFRGAGTDGMDQIKRLFSCRELPLSVCYRCPRSVVLHAQQWVPQIEYNEGAEEGILDLGVHTAKEVDHDNGDGESPSMTPKLEASSEPGRWQLTDYLPGDAILCRINRPLVAMTFALIRAKVPAKMLGRDIGAGLVKLAQKLGKGCEYATDGWRASFERHMAQYRQKEGARLSKRYRDAGTLAAMHDRMDMLQVFVDELSAGDGLGELVATIERLFGDNGPHMGRVVTLSTVHKFKGQEADRVFVLDADKYMPGPWASEGWQLEQEKNLMYVAATRAKKELRYIKSEEDQ